MNIIKVSNVSKTLKSFNLEIKALEKVSLNIKKGEIFSLLGPNGAGKTTLINCMINMIIPDKGKIIILNEDVSKNPQILDRLNLVSAYTKFFWALTPIHVMRFYGRLYNIKNDEIESRIKSLFKFFNIENLARRKVSTLSTGENTRLSFAKGLINNPEILLLDEPTLGLDPEFSVSLRQRIYELKKDYKTTILLTTHNMQEVEELADKVAFMHKGKIIDMGSKNLIKKKKFKESKIKIRLAKTPDKKIFEKLGFEIEGREISKNIKPEEMNSVLNILKKKGYKISDVDIEKSNLEDYFIDMVKK